MNDKTKRIIEHLEYLKSKETVIYNELDDSKKVKPVVFGRIQGLEDAIRFIKSE